MINLLKNSALENHGYIKANIVLDFSFLSFFFNFFSLVYIKWFILWTFISLEILVLERY